MSGARRYSLTDLAPEPPASPVPLGSPEPPDTPPAPQPVDMSATLHAVTSTNVDTTPAGEEVNGKVFSTRLPADLQRRIKIHAAVSGLSVQAIVADALTVYLEALDG